MALPADEPGGRSPRQLVLLPVEQDQPAEVCGPGDTGAEELWELADPWGPHLASATAITRRVGDLVELVDVTVPVGAAPGTTRCLVQQLVATLRRTDASMITSSVAGSSLRRELLAVGFVPLPGESATIHDSVSRGDRLILQL